MKLLGLLLAGLVLPLSAGVTVKDDASLRAALAGIKPGITLLIAPGEYRGGWSVHDVEGITVTALDPAKPPHFRGGTQAWHFSACQRLTVSHLRISGQTANGINVDDGGRMDKRCANVSLTNLSVGDIGPQGNFDAIKCSGLENLRISGCRIEGWGGQGIDLVGCQKVSISECELRGKEGFSASAGIQAKGGCADVVIEKCRLINAGPRPLNIGGSTGAAYFRPQGVKHEAARVTARDNHISGGECAAAFVGVDGALFSNNMILHPAKWCFRILQETRGPGFVPCRNVVISNNHIIFKRAQVRTEINIGDATEPGSFKFSGNRWFAEDQPERSRPSLPVEESGASYGVDPRAFGTGRDSRGS